MTFFTRLKSYFGGEKLNKLNKSRVLNWAFIIIIIVIMSRGQNHSNINKYIKKRQIHLITKNIDNVRH